MKLIKAQALAEQAIYDYTSSTRWQEVKYMKWTTAAKALVKNIGVIPCCMGEAKQLPQDKFCKACNLPTDGEKCYSKRCPV